MDKQEEILEGIIQEACCLCVHNTRGECKEGYEKYSGEYCNLAYKAGRAIVQNLHSQGVAIKVDTRWYVSNGEYLNPLTDKPVKVVAVEPLV